MLISTVVMASAERMNGPKGEAFSDDLRGQGDMSSVLQVLPVVLRTLLGRSDPDPSNLATINQLFEFYR